MTAVRRSKLALPAVLAASAIAVGCPSDDTGGPTTQGSESGGTTDAQELPDCPSIEDEALCPEEPGCIWYPDLALCVVDCTIIEDQATCDEQGFCYWTANDSCEFGGI